MKRLFYVIRAIIVIVLGVKLVLYLYVRLPTGNLSFPEVVKSVLFIISIITICFTIRSIVIRLWYCILDGIIITAKKYGNTSIIDYNEEEKQSTEESQDNESIETEESQAVQETNESTN